MVARNGECANMSAMLVVSFFVCSRRVFVSSQAVAGGGLVFFTCWFDRELLTRQWCLFFFAHVCISNAGRNLIEQTSGSRPSLLLLYTLLYGAYPALWPLPHALVRITGLFEYWRPWSWDLKALAFAGAALKNEAIYMLCLLSGGVISCAYQCIDVMVFADPNHPQSAFVVAWVRPIANLIVRRICYALLCYGLSRTTSPQAKFFGILLVHLVLTGLSVRLTTSCGSYGDLWVIILFDWSTFASRSVVVRPLLLLPSPSQTC